MRNQAQICHVYFVLYEYDRFDASVFFCRVTEKKINEKEIDLLYR